jgi:hypothetical protein
MITAQENLMVARHTDATLFKLLTVEAAGRRRH